MMIEGFLAFGLLLTYSALKGMGFKLSLIHLLLLSLMLKSIGLYMMGGYEVDYISFVYFNYFLVAFVLGVVISGYKNNNKLKLIISPVVCTTGRRNIEIQYLMLYFVVLCFVFYHYYVVGIPLFDANVEVVRFKASSSGLFGIPSRIVNFGILYLYICLLVLYLYGFINRKKFIVLSVLPVAVMLFSGSKSSLLVLVHLFIVTNRFRKYKFNKKVLMFSGLIVVSYFLYVFSRYETLADVSVLEYVINRMTIINANTFDYIVTTYKSVYEYGGGGGVLNDFLYPFYKLMGLDVSTVNTLISRSFYNVQGNGFSVPVTPGIFGYYYLEFGVYISIFLSFITGYLYTSVYCWGNVSVKLGSKIFFLFFEYMLFIAIGSGNPVYVLINYTVGAVILLVFLFIFKFIIQMVSNGKNVTFNYTFTRVSK